MEKSPSNIQACIIHPGYEQ